MGVGENTGGVDKCRTPSLACSNSGLKGFEHLIRLIMALVKMAKVEVSLRCFAVGDCAAELSLSDSEFFLSFGDESEQPVGLGRKVRLHSGGQHLRLVEAAPDERRCLDVKLAEVAHGVDVFSIELDSSLEGRAALKCCVKG